MVNYVLMSRFVITNHSSYSCLRVALFAMNAQHKNVNTYVIALFNDATDDELDPSRTCAAESSLSEITQNTTNITTQTFSRTY